MKTHTVSVWDQNTRLFVDTEYTASTCFVRDGNLYLYRNGFVFMIFANRHWHSVTVDQEG